MTSSWARHHVQLTVNAFNRPDQYASSRGVRVYCYPEQTNKQRFITKVTEKELHDNDSIVMSNVPQTFTTQK